MRLVDIAPMLEYLDLEHYDKDMPVSQYSADWIYSWLESQPTIEQPTWICCEERLPDENEIVFAWVAHLRDLHFCYGSELKAFEVTHWMPLPQPPKGG